MACSRRAQSFEPRIVPKLPESADARMRLGVVSAR